MFLLASRFVEAVLADGSIEWNAMAVGERVAVAVAKKDVVGEYCVDVAAESTFVDLLAEEVEVVVSLLPLPEEIIWWFVGQMKIGRPIVSLARVSMFSWIRFED